MIRYLVIKITIGLLLNCVFLFGNGIEIKEADKQSIFDNNQHLKEQISRSISQNLVYPKSAVKLRQSGIVIIGFMITVPNNIKNLHIINTSGFVELDNAAIRAIENSQKQFPIVDRELFIKVPLEFRLH
ncbi:MAG: energy transducer TonB [Arcobacteraceae bacterium]|jgi:protein TonB|nr:energy transducer TonB [Arcobacteraceae bacterium]